MTNEHVLKQVKVSYLKMLEKNNQILQALYECGVDNWEGYNEAMSLLPEEDDDE